MVCKICNGTSKTIFNKSILNKHKINYYQCGTCRFIQTDTPFWLNESYASAITSTDIGLINRNRVFSEMVSSFFSLSSFSTTDKYLDYGGGYGMYVRIMRDNGYNFFWSDLYSENIYSNKFSRIEPFDQNESFNAITAFEVFEHLEAPITVLEKLLDHSDTIIFSTELIPNGTPVENWWYVMPEHGQHIAFYHLETLQYIAGKYGLKLYTNGKTLHILTRKNLNNLFFKLACSYKFSRLYNTFFSKTSLLEKDYNFYLETLQP